MTIFYKKDLDFNILKDYVHKTMDKCTLKLFRWETI